MKDNLIIEKNNIIKLSKEKDNSIKEKDNIIENYKNQLFNKDENHKKEIKELEDKRKIREEEIIKIFMDKSQNQFMSLLDQLNLKINQDLKDNMNKIYNFVQDYKNN